MGTEGPPETASTPEAERVATPPRTTSTHLLDRKELLWERGAPNRLSAFGTPIQREGQSERSLGSFPLLGYI